MRQVRILCASLFVGLLLQPSAQAGMNSTIGLSLTLRQLHAQSPALPPLAYSEFCARYSGECRVRPAFRGPTKLSEEKWAELNRLNSQINERIFPERNYAGLAAEAWIINPERGDCNDYAVSKRHELLKRGWSSRNLLLGEVVTKGNEHHLVLVVRSRDGDYVLDNLSDRIKIWSRTPYRWVRMQSPEHPRMWATVGNRRPA